MPLNKETKVNLFFFNYLGLASCEHSTVDAKKHRSDFVSIFFMKPKNKQTKKQTIQIKKTSFYFKSNKPKK